jgi:hypothetical protein
MTVESVQHAHLTQLAAQDSRMTPEESGDAKLA